MWRFCARQLLVDDFEAHFYLAMAYGLRGDRDRTVAHLGPAIEMSRRDTRSLLSGYARAERSSTLAGPLFWAGLGLVAAAGLWYVAVGRAWQHSGFGLAAAVLASLPLVTPWLLDRAAGLLPPRNPGSNDAWDD